MSRLVIFHTGGGDTLLNTSEARNQRNITASRSATDMFELLSLLIKDFFILGFALFFRSAPGQYFLEPLG
jgi:hypothetical protein